MREDEGEEVAFLRRRRGDGREEPFVGGVPRADIPPPVQGEGRGQIDRVEEMLDMGRHLVRRRRPGSVQRREPRDTEHVIVLGLGEPQYYVQNLTRVAEVPRRGPILTGHASQRCRRRLDAATGDLARYFDCAVD